MESSINRRDSLQEFCKGKGKDLLAEVFFRELEFINGEPLADELSVVNHGMNSRVRSRDILGVQLQDDGEDTIHRKMILHLSRNGIYQQLPEFFFHPISVSSPTMSNREVVAAIRENRRKEKEAIRFFSLFDTETFKNSSHIFGRHLGMFEDPYHDNILQKISSLFYTTRSPLTKGEQYKLFLFLCHSEGLKENLEALGDVVDQVLNLRVVLKYTSHYSTELPYGLLGDCCLGEDSGIVGNFKSELDDVECKIYFDKIIDEDMLADKIKAVMFILSYFILSSRHINVIYTVTSNSELVLGHNYLGYDTNL